MPEEGAEYIFGRAAVPATATLASPMAPEAAPPAWRAYAESVNAQIGEWVSAEDEQAARFRALLDARRAGDDTAAPPLMLKLWIDRHGVIERITFESFGDTEEDQALGALIEKRALSASPPSGMLLPLRLVLLLGSNDPSDAR